MLGYCAGHPISEADFTHKASIWQSISPKLRDFSTLWKNIFHTVEKTGHFFHTMENLLAIFPHNGKTFRRFSTQWKNFFHSVENPDYRLFSGVFGLFSGGCGAEQAAPLEHRRARRPRGREKRCPTKAGSALSRTRLGCGVGNDRFSGPEVGDRRALRCEGGVARERSSTGGC